MNQATQQAKQDTQPAPELRILKTGNCPSLSGKSKLTYHIGCTSEFEIQFRVFSNTGSGFFSNEWVSLNSILGVFDESNCIISFVLHKLYKGKSLNNSGFLMAVLKNEGLVIPSADSRSYQRNDVGKFMAEIKVLIEQPVDQIAEVKPKKSLPSNKTVSGKSA